MALTTPRQATRRSRELPTRLMVANCLVAVALFALVYRLYALQVLRGEELSHKGRRNFVSQVQIPHDRGILYDRYGRILADNRPSHALQVTPAFLGRAAQQQKTLAHVAELVGMAPDETARVIQLVQGRTGLERFRPLVIRRDLDPEQVEAIEGERGIFLLDGVDIVEGRRRSYVYGALMAHLLGYTSEIDAGALEAERARGNPHRYDLGDLIGREGIERTHEEALRGTDGVMKVVVDAKGRRQQSGYIEALLGAQRRIEPTPGHNVYLTIDLELQQRAEEAFLRMGRAGSVVAIDPRTGAILVLASLPAYNVNIVASSFSRDEKEKLDNDPLKPWLNRSIQGQYAPGSTFKIVPALAALDQHAVRTQERIFCPGFYKMGRHTWRCHKDAGHGPVDLHDAIKASCDVWFYTLGGRIGIDSIARMARVLSFGSRTGIPLRGEQPGLVPDEAFHNRANRATGGYTRGMAINTSIGQGSLLVTPLQLAVAYSAIANGNQVLAPQLVDRIETADMRRTLTQLPRQLWQEPQSVSLPPGTRPSAVRGSPPEVVQPFRSRATADLTLPAADLAQVRRALVSVADEPGGTAYRYRSRKVSMAAKTGTAQVVKLGLKRVRTADTTYLERDHAWAVAYAPSENPEIVVAVLNEHAGHGGSASAPIATEVIDMYFSLKEARLAEASGSSGKPSSPPSD